MTTAAKKKLELVRGTKASMALAQGIAMEMPTGLKLKKVSRPTILKIESIPIGQAVSGELIALADSLSKDSKMKDSKLLLLRNSNDPKNPVDFYLPCTGVIKSSLGGHEGIEKIVGSTIFFKRKENGASAKYNGNKMFDFDIFVQEKSGK